MKKFKTLILDRRDIEGLISMREAISAVEDAFRQYGLNRTQMPP
jgi:ornithine cyclodeaminase/alanine dehydrogenase-like protein (mu-crystallin family)